MPVKIKIFLPIFLGIILAVSVLTFLSIRIAQQEINHSIEKSLQLEVETIIKMFERERALKLDIVKKDLKVAHNLFYADDLQILASKISMEVTNQITHYKHIAHLNRWYLNNQTLINNFGFVDKAYSLTEGTITVFQKIDSGFVRISTNVMNDAGERAVGTYIPNSSPVVKTIENGETFIGRAYVVNDWYITAYEPIYYKGELVGMLYVGDKEKDLGRLRTIINGLKIGRTGFVFVFDEYRELTMHPDNQGGKLDESFFKNINNSTEGIFEYSNSVEEKRIYAFEYFPDFRLFVCATIDKVAESQPLVSGIISNAVLIALITIILFSVFSFLFTTRNVHRFLVQIERSNKELATARDALKKSEEQFRTLFNNSSDDIFVGDFDGFIIEVNDVACNSLGYTRDELIGKQFHLIKTERYLGEVKKNLEMIKHFGQYTYETENLAKDGKVIPVEMKSRVIEYHGKKRILTIARDITERKEIEERILKAIISTEENERKNFAADLHDDLGPILSTIKLYTDLLKKPDPKNIDKTETVNNIDELVDMAISTSREISNRIRPNVLQDFGLAAAINEFCGFINESGKLKIEARFENYKIEERGIVESILFQAVKELVNNTIKHSNAENVFIDLKSFENQIILYYRDDGQGFDMDEAIQNKSGLGLYNIFNKVKTINGSCDLNSEEGKGMFMVISVKLNNE